MGLFDFFKSSKNKITKSVTNDLGTFILVEKFEALNFEGIINSKIGTLTKINFPPVNGSISVYQIAYFRKIESNWESILNQMKEKFQKIDFTKLKVASILIPDIEDNSYGMDAEIVFENKKEIISVILKGEDIEEIIQI